MSNNPDEDPDNEEGPRRGFNNPNIQITVKFKNKVKNNNYEFIVTITPEGEKSKTIKQYKVKRNLYEF